MTKAAPATTPVVPPFLFVEGFTQYEGAPRFDVRLGSQSFGMVQLEGGVGNIASPAHGDAAFAGRHWATVLRAKRSTLDKMRAVIDNLAVTRTGPRNRRFAGPALPSSRRPRRLFVVLEPDGAGVAEAVAVELAGESLVYKDQLAELWARFPNQQARDFESQRYTGKTMAAAVVKLCDANALRCSPELLGKLETAFRLWTPARLDPFIDAGLVVWTHTLRLPTELFAWRLQCGRPELMQQACAHGPATSETRWERAMMQFCSSTQCLSTRGCGPPAYAPHLLGFGVREENLVEPHVLPVLKWQLEQASRQAAELCAAG